MQPSIFSEAEGEDILSWLNKFEFIAANNNLIKEKQGCLISMYFDKPTLSTKNAIYKEQIKNTGKLLHGVRQKKIWNKLIFCMCFNKIYVIFNHNISKLKDPFKKKKLDIKKLNLFC